MVEGLLILIQAQQIRLHVGPGLPQKLWLSRHMPELKGPIAPTAQRRMRIGTEVGLMAKRLFPAGITIPVWE